MIKVVNWMINDLNNTRPWILFLGCCAPILLTLLALELGVYPHA